MSPRVRILVFLAAGMALLASACTTGGGGGGGGGPVNVPPVASFTVNPTSGVAGSTVFNVNASASSDPDGTIASYTWNWGDGSPASSGVTSSHTYASAGLKSISLIVTDNLGATGPDSKQVTVTAAPVDADGDNYFVPAAPPFNVIDCNDGDASINPGAADAPGDNIDQNCDGFDGTDTTSIRVSAGGSISSTCGLTADPCGSIDQAETNAQSGPLAPRTQVWISGGVYGPFTVHAGLQIVGGYNSSWGRGGAGSVATINGTYNASYNGNVAIEAINITSATVVRDFTVNAGTASAGRVAYGVYVSGSSSALTLNSLLVNGGAAGSGTAGSNGANATSLTATGGMTGGNGGNSHEPGSVCDTSTSGAGGAGGTNPLTGQNGGTGGSGGTQDSGGCPGGQADSTSGNTGTTGSSSGAAGGAGGGYSHNTGFFANICNPASFNPRGDGKGGNGNNGTAGAIADGSAGSGASATNGSAASGIWTKTAANGGTGATGATGKNGGGAGGGGGSDCGNDDYGAGGGGGGAGGQAALAAGTGGTSGMASIAIFLNNSSPTLTGIQIAVGTGGAGGAGGLGGTGQAGGSGGSGGNADCNNSDPFPTGACGGTGDGGGGGSGGAGGRGGHAGAAGGGAGGPAIGLLLHGASSPTGTPTIGGGAGGVGGAAGTGSLPGTAGGTGSVTNTLTL